MTNNEKLAELLSRFQAPDTPPDLIERINRRILVASRAGSAEEVVDWSGLLGWTVVSSVTAVIVLGVILGCAGGESLLQSLSSSSGIGL